MKKRIWSILRYFRLAGIIQLWLKSSLTEDGWFRSFHLKQAVDAGGKPLPWLTYPFIKAITDRLDNSMKVFEYGSGNSTLWFAGKVKSVKSVEHDEVWVQKLATQLPANAQVVFRSLTDKDSYAQEVGKAGEKYDLIIIDGRERVLCAKSCLPHLSTKGVVILDNAERESYLPAREYLTAQGFKCLDFWGMPVGSAHNSCTALYYRVENALNI